jgi:hypothetical protein
MIDSIKFELDISNYPPEIRNNIIRHFLKKESYNIETTKARVYRDLEFGFSKRNLGFSLIHPSSHYEIKADLNDLTKVISFNFSIPKLLYGTNLFLSVYHYWFKDTPVDSQYFNESEIESFYKIMLNSIFEVVNSLCEEEIPVNILIDSLNIVGIDICRNYIFDSKEHALSYIDDLKQLKIPYSKKPRTYEDSLMFVFDDYSFKVYHKGNEIGKQMKFISKLYPEHKRLQDIADRTVRYECSFRVQKIRDLFMKTFRSNCPIFCSYDESLKNKFSQRKVRLCKKRSDYYFRTPDEEVEYAYYYGKPNKKFYPEGFYNPVLDLSTLVELYEFSGNIFNIFQCQKRPELITLSKIIDEFNMYCEYSGEKKMNKGNLMKIFKMMESNTLNELVDQKAISKATKYNLLKKFRKIGINLTDKCKVKHQLENIDIEGSLFMEIINEWGAIMVERTMSCNVHYLESIR